MADIDKDNMKSHEKHVCREKKISLLKDERMRKICKEKMNCLRLWHQICWDIQCRFFRSMFS